MNPGQILLHSFCPGGIAGPLLLRFFGRNRSKFSAWLALSAMILGLSVSAANAQDQPPPGVGEVEFAEASVDRYTPPDPRQSLRPEGRAKSLALTQYYLGLSREKAGDVEGALDSFQKVLEVRPDQLRLATKAAELAGQFGDSKRGREILEKSFQANRNLPAAYLRLSEFLWTYHDNQRSNRERALELVEEAAKRFSHNPAIYDRLITLHLARKDRNKAREVLTQALESSSDDPNFWLNMAPVAQKLYPIKQEPAPVLINKIYEKALKLGKGNPDIENKVADYYSFTKQYKLARDLYIAIIKERPEELKVREKLARVYRLLGEEDKVLETLIALERINPHRLETQRFLAQIYYQRGETAEKEGKSGSDLGHWANSIKHYLKAFRIARGQAFEYRLVSTMMLWEDRASEAIDLLKRAQFHYPDDLAIQIDMGRAFNADDQYDKAFDLFKATEDLATQSQPDLLTDAFYFSFGASAERLKKFEDAAKLFRKSIDLVPQNNPQRAAMPYNYLGYMWLEQDMNIEEAGQLIIMANDLNPDSGAYIDSLGWYFFKKGEFQNAVDTLLRAAKVMKENEDHEDAVVYDHIGQAYFQLGQLTEAVDYLQKATKLEPENEEFAGRLKEYQEAAAAQPNPAPGAATPANAESEPETQDSPPEKAADPPNAA